MSRALASSLEQDEAFDRFLRELSGVFEFERLAIVLVEGDEAVVMANSGVEAEGLYPRGTARPIAGSVLEDVARELADDRTRRHGHEPALPGGAGARTRRAALARRRAPRAGGQLLGMLSVSRAEADAFSADEVDLVTMLARQVGFAVQNMRAYAAERNAAEELRRLSALRADFVSLVSHELRAPMASVIGCAATLRQRWRELTPEQRESFLALIEQETGRLSTLIGDVLDTSQIEAGTFTYVFADVDLGELVRETASMVELGHDEVKVVDPRARPAARRSRRPRAPQAAPPQPRHQRGQVHGRRRRDRGAGRVRTMATCSSR